MARCITDTVGLGPDARALIAMIDAARVGSRAQVVVAGDTATITLGFAHDMWAEARPVGPSLPEDELALQILGWRGTGDGVFVREWRAHTTSAMVADDLTRALLHGYQCREAGLQLSLREPARTSAR